MSDIDDLTKPLTAAEVESAIYTAIAANGANTTNWKTGAVVRVIVTACSIVIAACSSLLTLIARSRFLEFAEGTWLRLAARYDYGTEWNGPTFAAGPITLNNTGGGIYSYAIGALVFVNTATQKLYRNTTAVNIGSLQTGVSVSLQAVEAGAASSALPGEIAFSGNGPAGVVIVQSDPMIGADGELDPSLRARAREAVGPISPDGPFEAYAAVAKAAKRANGTWIGVTRVSAIRDGMGGIDLYVATDTGGVTGAVGNLATDLGCVDDACQRLATPLGITLRTHSATPLAIDVTYAVWLPASANRAAADVTAAISTELGAFLGSAPVGGFDPTSVGGGKIYLDALKATIGMARVDPADSSSPRLGIFRTETTTPSANTSVGASEVPIKGTISGSVNFVGA